MLLILVWFGILNHLLLFLKGEESKGPEAIVQALFTNTSLITLDLSGNNNQIDRLLDAALKKQAILQDLTLNDSCLGDVGAQDFLAAVTDNHDNHALTKVDMGGNRMGVLGITAILPFLPQLTYLSLWNNWFGDAGPKLLADNLKENTSLVSFSCGFCALTCVSKQALVDCLHVNTTLIIMWWDGGFERN